MEKNLNGELAISLEEYASANISKLDDGSANSEELKKIE
jgi:hypothetical protein